MMPKLNKNHSIALLIFTVLLNLSLAAQDTGRTPTATWQVLKYDLNVTLPPDATRSVTVNAAISLKNVSGRPANTLTLRVSPLAEVSSVKINNATVEFSKSEEKISSATSLQRLATRLTSVAPDASFTAIIDYKINLKDNSALASVTPTASQFLPLSFWYPTPNSWYFPRGADSAAVKLKVTAPDGQTVVSAGSETGGAFESKLNGQPFFVTGNWEMSSQNGVSVFMPKGAGNDGQKRSAELATILVDARTFLVGIFGKAPDIPLRIVAGRRGAGFGSGGTIIVDEAVFRRSKIDSLTAMNITEAAVKLWLGGSVTVDGEGYGIIGEGLTKFIATQFIESKYGKETADIERLRQRIAYAAVSKRDAPLTMVSPVDDFYYSEVANKGAMAWRILAKRIGFAEFSEIVRANMLDGTLTVGELRAALSANKPLIDYLFDQETDMNLLIGLPQIKGAETTVALKNTGAADVMVDIVATTAGGEKLTASTTLKAADYGEVTFRSNSKITRVEIDSEKLYPQTEYFDDIAPRESTDSDPLLATKRHFDKKDFANAESTARVLLRDLPDFDDLRVLLGRSLLAQNKTVEAEREFKAVLNQKLPTSRSIAWANVGLGEIASKSNQKNDALKYAEAAIAADAEYGASYAARVLRNNLGLAATTDAGVKAFFADFDKAASSNRKADVDALTVRGEVTRFAGGISGSTEQWQTQIRQIDRIDANTVLVEANMTVKLLTKDTETGIAVFRLINTGNGWKLSTVEMFEVR